MWFRKMDRNADGDVSRSEYLGTRAEFDAIDADADDLISLEEAETYDEKLRPREVPKNPKPRSNVGARLDSIPPAGVSSRVRHSPPHPSTEGQWASVSRWCSRSLKNEESPQTALSAWTQQTLPADRFEIIVVADNRVAVRARVAIASPPARPRDPRRLRQPRPPVRCRAFARGPASILFLTESHCIPAPDCLEAMDRWLAANTGVAGACCESVPVWDSPYQLIDATTFEEGFRHFIDTNDWRKLSVHGMALRRDLYLAAGGLQHQYGRFAEMVLAAALRDAGHQLGYARESIVTHHYRETLQELIDGTDEYVASECVYRAANPGPDRIGHTYLPDMPNPFSPGARALDRDIVTTLLAGAVGRNTRVMREAINGVGRVLAGLLGRRGPVLPPGWRSRPVEYAAGGTATMRDGSISRTANWFAWLRC